MISALGYNRAREALDAVVRFAEHPDVEVRFHVAAAPPSLVNPDRIGSGALDALRRLCKDSDADVRFYALYALLEEVAGVDRSRINELVAGAMTDPDEPIRRLTREHHNGAT